MSFGTLFKAPQAKLVEIELGNEPKKPTKKVAAKLKERGCDYCPQNKTKGINKIFTPVKGKDIMIFTTAPGRAENQEEEHLVGDSGKFLWDELRKVGIKRNHCDVQSAVRCFPADRVQGELKQRDPNKEEIRCCSLYSDKAKAKSKAKVYIILGGMAHTAVLGKEFKKSKRIFWSETLKAKVYCLAHPNYFLRGQYPQSALTEFREALKAVAKDLTGKTVSQYSYIEEQDYRAVTTIEQGEAVNKLLRTKAAKGIRITADIEHDTIDGKFMLLCCGFSYKPGQSFVFILDHPKSRKVDGKWAPLKLKVRKGLHKIVAGLIADKTIKKAFHQGSSDVPVLENVEGVKVKGYDFDTIYAAFLDNPDDKAYGLTAIGLRKYPEFGDYKHIILPECIPPGTDLKEHKMQNADLTKLYDYVGPNDLMHFSYLPLRKLVLRNGADTDLTKRIELDTRKKVNKNLLKVYIDAGFVLADMEPNGPEFDYKHCEKLKLIYPPRYEKVLRQIRKIAKDKKFKPSSPKQLKKLLYEDLNITPPEIAFNKKKKRKRGPDGKLVPLEPGTGKNVMEVLGRKYKIARLITEFRRLGKIISTYINAYEACANYNGGRLRTKWNLTGTGTGRLSSGGDKGAARKTNRRINLQNIHGDYNLQNLVTPDKDWRKVYDVLLKRVKNLFPDELRKIKKLLQKLQSTSDKDAKKRITALLYGDYEKKIEGYLDKLKKKLNVSKEFKAFCKWVVKKFGDVAVLMGFDQGQIEVRVMAQASGDKNLIKDCMSSDIHSKVGHRMTGWAEIKIKRDKKTRTLTKNIHFGILFGLGANGLMSFILVKDPDSTITEEEAQRLYDNYFKQYPGVRIYIQRQRKHVEEMGYVENMFGFRRPLGNAEVLEGYDNDNEQEGDQEGGAYWGNQAINCLDFKTEALTQRGWVKGQDLKAGDVLLTKNAGTNKLEWQAAQDVKVYPDYKQPLMLFKSSNFNAASTLDHRWLVGKRYPHERLTHEITENMAIHRTGEYNAPPVSPYTDNFVRLVGWALTDGSFRSGKGYSKSAVSLCQSRRGNPEKVAMIDKLLVIMQEKEGLIYRTRLPKNRSKDEVFWFFAGKVGVQLRALFPHRELTPQFLTQLTKKQLNILLHTMILGDGTGSKLDKLASKHKGSSGKANCILQFGTASKAQADAFQMLVSLTGRHATLTIRDYSAYNDTRKKYASMGNVPVAGHTHYSLNICRRTVAKVYPTHKKLIKNVGVWCPIVPNTYFVARRKGQVFITGNTPIQGAAHQLMLMAVAALRTKKAKYKVLGVPTLEVHDYIGFKTKLKNLLKALPLCKELLEKEPLAYVKKYFPKIKWKIPLVVEGKVGFRYGDSVDLEDDAPMNVILGNMFLETYAKEVKLDKDVELAKAA